MIETDALIIGAGPAGLFQAFQFGLQEIRSHIVDALPCAGGQCIELYADKPIYDIPGTPLCTGRELIASLQQQLAPFDVPLHLDQQVSAVAPQADGRFVVATSAGTQFLVKVISIAAGLGAFQPRPLRVEGLARFEGSQLFYRVADPAAFAGRDVLVVGGEEQAVEGVLRLAEAGAEAPRSLALLHRRDVFQAPFESLAELEALRGSGLLRVETGQVTGFTEADGRLKALEVSAADDSTRHVAVDALLVLQGLSPKLGPIADWGLALERKQLVVDTATFSTSVPGIHAVGDINTYPGKRKLILSGFHEATLAAFAAVERVFPGRKAQLEYTTTSTRLHRLLGLSPSNKI